MVAEVTDLSSSDVHKIFALSDRIRIAGNELVAIMRKHYNQLMRTKRYRKLLKLYGETKDKEKRKSYADQLQKMQAQYNVTWDFCRESMMQIRVKYGLDAIFALTKAESIWHAVESCLYREGKELHFSKYGEFPCIRAKQINRGIPMHVKDGKLLFNLGSISFGIQVKDRFQTDEVNAVLSYLTESDRIDREAVNAFETDRHCIDTYRPCYASLVPEIIRGKQRLFLHLTIEGKALPKFDRYGNPRHKYGTGIIGADIGTQTVAYTLDTEVGLRNLAERGLSILQSERLERLYNRAMDRSRRAMNPEYYNPDGTVKKGKKTWVCSKHYKKIRTRHAELCRKNAINRHLAINEEVNRLRALGDTFITEPKIAKKLMKRAKKTTVNKNGKINRKKRHGKSIKNRCPGYFQSTAEKKFTLTGGVYIEVSDSYRASQYDHTADDYIKKKLSERMYKLKDGTLVQRDWYSSFLLYCYSFNTDDIDKEKCLREFDKFYSKEKDMIETIKANKIKILNSGIKIA